MIPRLRYPLHSLPSIEQCGLCTHGTKVRETFRQSKLWSLHLYHYAGQLEFRGEVHDFHPGWASLIPPREETTWIFPNHATHHYVHFRAGTGRRTSLPLVGPAKIGDLMASMPGLFQENPQFANVRLWDALIFLAGEPPKSAEQGLHPHVQIALSEIRNAGPGMVSAATLARKMGVSRNHLDQCFRREMGCGIQAYTRRRKTEQALHLLRESDLDIKSIAIECGLPDLQQFNKLIHRATGQSPRNYRAVGKGRM
ncbi:MAG: hypothetical protein Fur0032_06660 [Terrimicrobiaceae bacterium]